MVDSVKLFFDLLGRTEGERDIARFGQALEQTGDDARKASKGHQTLAEGTRALSAQMAAAQQRARDLRTEFSRSGDTGLLKDIGKAERDVKRLQGWMRALGGDTNHSAAAVGLFATASATAAEATTKLGAGVLSATGSLGPYGVVAVGGTAATLGFAAAAAAGGAAIAGFGLGVIGAGAMVRSGSAGMTDALNDIGKTSHDVFFDASASIEHEMIPALGTLEGEIRALEPRLTDLFAGPSKAIQPLSQGIVGLTENAMPGLQDAADASGQVLKVIAEELPNLGDVVGDFFTSISSGSEGGADALLTMIHVLEILITTIGNTIEGAEKMWGWLDKMPGSGVQVLSGLAAKMADVDTQQQKVSGSGHSAARAIEHEAEIAEIAKGATRSLAEALGLLNFGALDAAQAQIASAQATNRFADALKDSKGQLTGNAAATLATRSAALSALEGYARTADSVTKLTNDVGKGTSSFYSNVAALRATTPAGSAARAQLDALIATFVKQRGVAERSADSVASVNTQIALLRDKQVTARARGDAGEVIRLQNEIDRLRNKTVYVTAVVRRTSGISEVVSYGANPMGGQQRETGGPVRKGMPYIVGEKRPELFVPEQNGTILPRVPATATVGGGGVGGGGITNHITIQVTSADPDAVVRALKKYAEANGGVTIKGGVTAV